MENHIGWQINKMLGFLPKTENQMLKNKKTQTATDNRKPQFFSAKLIKLT